MPDFLALSVGVTEAPFKWNYIGEEFDMKLISGFIGIEETSDGYVKPQIGWAIGQITDPPKYEEDEGEADEGESGDDTE